MRRTTRSGRLVPRESAPWISTGGAGGLATFLFAFFPPLAFCLLALAGCQTPESPNGETLTPSESVPAIRPDGLVKIPIDGPGRLFSLARRPIGGYDEIFLSPARVSLLPDGRSRAERERIERRISTYIDDRLRAQSLAAGAPLVEIPGRCTLIVVISIQDLSIEEPPARANSSTSFVASWGAATIVQNIYDAETRRPLLQYGSRRNMRGSVGGSGGSEDWSKVNETLGNLLEDSRLAIRTALPPIESPPVKPGCQGALTALVREAP